MCETSIHFIYWGPRETYLESPKLEEWIQNFAFNPNMLKWAQEKSHFILLGFFLDKY